MYVYVYVYTHTYNLLLLISYYRHSRSTLYTTSKFYRNSILQKRKQIPEKIRNLLKISLILTWLWADFELFSKSDLWPTQSKALQRAL